MLAAIITLSTLLCFLHLSVPFGLDKKQDLDESRNKRERRGLDKISGSQFLYYCSLWRNLVEQKVVLHGKSKVLTSNS